MTVKSLKTAKAVVEEMGINNVNSVWQYTTPEGDKNNFAIFTKNQLVDIYYSPFCINPKLIFIDGDWI